VRSANGAWLKPAISAKARKRGRVYLSLRKHNGGKAPCYVCGRHVHWEDATLEHILPRSLGGTYRYSNLSISHRACNWRRGNTV
jgi:5-methylcytosine-specific restriction endonuclease McrA